MKEITRIWSSKIWLSSWSVRLLRRIWLLLLELGTSRRGVGGVGHVFAFNFKTEVSLSDHIYKLLEQMTRKTDIWIDWLLRKRKMYELWVYLAAVVCSVLSLCFEFPLVSRFILGSVFLGWQLFSLSTLQVLFYYSFSLCCWEAFCQPMLLLCR